MSIEPGTEPTPPDQSDESELRQARERIRKLSSELAAARSNEQAALATAIAWRTRAVASWATTAAAARPMSSSDELEFLRSHTHAVTQELEAIRHTLSWRVTKPLRSVRTVLKVVGR